MHGFEKEEKAVWLVDEEGRYRGDWRTTDAEPIRQILILFNLCLNWFETTIHSQLISLFAQVSLKASDIEPFLFDF